MLFSHGVTCFLVFYLALFPFLHHVGRFYLGVYELSTPCLHVYKMLQLAGRSNTMLCKSMVFLLLFDDDKNIPIFYRLCSGVAGEAERCR